jgi:hypothetical protein
MTKLKFQREKRLPINTIMVNYEDDILVIKAFSKGIEKIFIVPAIEETRTEIVLNKESKHETVIITYAIINHDINKWFFPTVVFPKNKNVLGETPIVIERVADKLQVYTDSNFDKYIFEMVSKEN